MIICLERVIPTLKAYAYDHPLSIPYYNLGLYTTFPHIQSKVAGCDVASRALCLFLMLPYVGLQYVIVAFPDHLLERILLLRTYLTSLQLVTVTEWRR